MSSTIRNGILGVFLVLTGLSIYYSTQLSFTFSLDQFFPEGDEDLAFYKEFEAQFEQDVNFLLVALTRDAGVFDSVFLAKAKQFTSEARQLPLVTQTHSLTSIRRPVKTPFGVTSLPLIHPDEPARYDSDKARILADDRWVRTLIDDHATALIVVLKTKEDALNIRGARRLIGEVKTLLDSCQLDDYHLLGSPYFTKEMVAMQKKELAVNTALSAVLVCLVMYLIFRRFWGTVLALVSILLGMLLFLGYLGCFGRELNLMSALYPMLMIIVGTSDVVHIMSKYIDELRKGKARDEAIRITIHEIGLATLLTSLTTAIGFFALVTSRVGPIRAFGFNAAIGVGIAYLTVVMFTTAVISMFRTEQLIRIGPAKSRWDYWMDRVNELTKRHPKRIGLGGVVVFLLCLIGIFNITTNYRLASNLPSGKKLTEDFHFFEEKMAGFRPVEIAVFAQGEYRADDFEVLQEVDKVEGYLRSIDELASVQSMTMLYKSIHQMYVPSVGGQLVFPTDKATFLKYRRMADKVSSATEKVLLSEDRKVTRISTRAKDIGADRLENLGGEIAQWIEENTDPNIAVFKETGTGLIMDKNADYIQRNLLQGLGMAVGIISLLMAGLFRNWRMVVVSLVPNIFPLLMAGALLGYLGIELDAGVSIIFAIIFGIAVDDTIHFLSKFKLSLRKGLGVEEAISITFRETGKAICLTSIILFFGFMVLLVSIHPPSVTIGLLISVTLASAVVGDLLLIPVMIRRLIDPAKI